MLWMHGSIFCCIYNGGQKISSTTVVPFTYAVKQPLGTNNHTSHVDMKLTCVNHYDDKGQTTPNFCEMTGKGWTKFFGRNSSTIGSMEFRAAVYLSFKKTCCSLSFIVIPKCHM
jgi:hypothetical protein